MRRQRAVGFRGTLGWFFLPLESWRRSEAGADGVFSARAWAEPEGIGTWHGGGRAFERANQAHGPPALRAANNRHQKDSPIQDKMEGPAPSGPR